MINYNDDKTVTATKGPSEEELASLAVFEEHFKSGMNFLRGHHKTIERNKEFAFENQWDAEEKNKRQDPIAPRPCLTFNKVLRIGKRIINDAEQMKLGIKVVAVDNGADPLIAEVYNTVIRKIEQDNRCASIRRQGFEDALFSNYGFWRVYTDWEHEKSFDKKIVVKRIVDNRMVLFPETSIEPDLSDAEWFVLYHRLQKAEAKAKHPNIDFKSSYPDGLDVVWGSEEEGYVIAEHFYLKYKEVNLIRMDDESVMSSKAVDEDTKALWQSLTTGYKDVILFEDELDATGELLWSKLPESFKKLMSRKSQKKVWYWCKFAGRTLIAEQEWDGTIAPIVFCSAREYWKGGKRNWMCVTTLLRDPQQLYNFYRSTQAERLTMAADAPWLLTAEHIAGYENLWKTAHTKPLRYLLYNLKHGGELLPKPERNQPITGDPGLDVEVQRLDAEILDISGVNLASFGESSGERTGKAILVRQRQGELVNADYIDGYTSALYREAQIYLDLIPKTYTWEQAIRLLGEEKRGLVEQLEQKGLLGWGNGKYDLEIDIGSVSSTAREDERNFWEGMIQANPQIAPLVMDVLAKNTNSKDAKLLAKRFQAVLPPEARHLVDENGSSTVNAEVEQVKAQAQQEMAQMQESMQAQIAQGQKAMEENQQLKMNSDIKRQELQIKARELEIKELELSLKADELAMKNGEAEKKIELEYYKIRAEMNRNRQPVGGQSGNPSGSARA